jgi:hypothetical protein
LTDSIYEFLVTTGESLTMGSTEQQQKQPSHVAVCPRTYQRSTGRVRTLLLRFIRCFGGVITAVLIAWRIAAAPTAASLPTPYSSILDRSGGLVYRTGVIQSKEEWNTIVTEATALSKSSSLREESVSSIARHRLGIALSPTSSPTVQILNDPQSAISQLIQKVAGTVTHPNCDRMNEWGLVWRGTWMMYSTSRYHKLKWCSPSSIRPIVERYGRCIITMRRMILHHFINKKQIRIRSYYYVPELYHIVSQHYNMGNVSY